MDKIRYSLSGVVINKVKDVICDGYVKRTSAGKTIFIEEGLIVRVEQDLLLKQIPKQTKEVRYVENNNIGVIDTETYRAADGSIKIYALGFKSILDKDVSMYYINKNIMDHTKLVLDFVDELLRPKYSKMIFYCHKLGGYDIVFLLKVIYLFNESTSEENK